MAIKQVVTSTGEPIYRGDDRVVIGTADPAEPAYPTGYSPGVLFVEIVEDEDE
jgi:hypothetical protein